MFREDFQRESIGVDCTTSAAVPGRGMLLRRVPCALVTRLQCQRTLSTSAIAEDSPVELAYKRFDVEKAINPPVVLIHGLLHVVTLLLSRPLAHNIAGPVDRKTHGTILGRDSRKRSGRRYTP